MAAGKKDLGTIKLGLFGNICPKTVSNFLAFSEGNVNGLGYAGSPIHRIIPKFMIQGKTLLGKES